MSKEVLKRSRAIYFAMLGMVAVLSLTMWGCGTSGYDDPQAAVTTTKTANASIDAVTLQKWITEGKVNSTDPSSRDKVVILSVSPATNYNAAHIPGAQLMNSATELTMTRMEGVAPIGTMVLDGGTMDTIIKRSGIDSNTTVVFTVAKGQSYMNTARAYFTFRYWGFPKERLKVLNGGDDAWETAGYTLTTDAPSVTGSTFSVRNNSTFHADLRYSIGEMINLVDQLNLGTKSTAQYKVMDVRGPASALPTVYIANAIVDDFARFTDSAGTGKTATFASPTDLQTRFGEKGVTASVTQTTVYCASGMRAAVVFFALDGVLGWPVNMYDGSWNQWAAYRYVAPPVTVPPTSPSYLPSSTSSWSVAINTPTTSLPRTTGTLSGGSIVVDPLSHALFSSVTDSRANQIFLEDTLYFNGGTSAAPPVSGGGDSSDC